MGEMLKNCVLCLCVCVCELGHICYNACKKFSANLCFVICCFHLKRILLSAHSV